MIFTTILGVAEGKKWGGILHALTLDTYARY